MTTASAQRQQDNSQEQVSSPALAEAPVKAAVKSASAFRTISEVADELGVQQHVLRFWETKFSQIRPLKRGGGRRYYRPEDMALLKRIHHLLYTEGYTIRGVQNLMKGQGRGQIIQGDLGKPQDNTPAAVEVFHQGGNGEEAVESAAAAPQTDETLSAAHRQVLETMLTELKDMRDMLRDKA